ncbi:MAG: DOPA 4,5-dioxygenase family protein [Alphaproteobacteria bacterium]|nr:DOPA 4,5-dioxygenase family protein [Alphaproteobacteria bacterium]
MSDARAIESYHAHVYFDAASRDRAWALRERAGRELKATVGRFHERAVGPHPQWSYQLEFAPAELANIVPWLMLHRDGLTVFLHPNTGDAVADHTRHAAWMGSMQALNLDALR